MGNFSRILLTGGTGFAGKYVTQALARAYPEAKRFILKRKAHATEGLVGWEGLVGDVTETTDVDAAISNVRPDLIFHMAAQSSVAVASVDGEQTWRVNYGGTVALANAVRLHVPSATFFFTSSAEVYGDSFHKGPLDEAAPLSPRGDYGKSKASAERALAEIMPNTSRVIVARAFNHTGPQQTTSFVLPMIASQVAKIEAGILEPVLRVGNLAPRRDFLHVGDLVSAYLELLKLSPRLGLGGVAASSNTFNVTSGVSHRIGDLVGKFLERARIPIRVEVDRSKVRPDEIQEVCGIFGKLNSATGWQPTVPIEKIIDELLLYWRSKTSVSKEE